MSNEELKLAREALQKIAECAKGGSLLESTGYVMGKWAADALEAMDGCRAAPPVAAPGASIDSPEFRGLMLAAATAWPTQAHNIKRLADHIDARMAQHGEKQFQAGLRHAHQQALTVTHALMAERDEAKASLARLVNDIGTLRRIEGRRYFVCDDVFAILPAKADKPKGCTGTPACCPDNEGYGCACTPMRTTSDAAYESLTPERRKKLDSEILLLEQRMQEHRRSRERRQHVVPVAVERRIADARGSGVHQDRNKD